MSESRKCLPYDHGMAIDRWLRIELRHLLALAAVAEEGSFSAAGERLGYVQSAISHQIAALEAIVGTRLVERSRGQKPVALTPNGLVLYEHARSIVARIRTADAQLADTQQPHALDIGSFQAVSSKIVVPVLQRLDPQLHVRLVEQTTEHGLLDRLAEGRLDAAFTEGPLPSGPFESVALFEDP
jgi:DNA-binding transcriptional LysR family regulator